jgi:hypothetical protein
MTLFVLQPFLNGFQTLLRARIVFDLFDALLHFAQVNGFPQALGGSHTPLGTLRKRFAEQHSAAAAAAFGFVCKELDQPATVGTGDDHAIELSQTLPPRALVGHG